MTTPYRIRVAARADDDPELPSLLRTDFATLMKESEAAHAAKNQVPGWWIRHARDRLSSRYRISELLPRGRFSLFMAVLLLSAITLPIACIISRFSSVTQAICTGISVAAIIVSMCTNLIFNTDRSKCWHVALSFLPPALLALSAMELAAYVIWQRRGGEFIDGPWQRNRAKGMLLTSLEPLIEACGSRLARACEALQALDRSLSEIDARLNACDCARRPELDRIDCYLRGRLEARREALRPFVTAATESHTALRRSYGQYRSMIEEHRPTPDAEPTPSAIADEERLRSLAAEFYRSTMKALADAEDAMKRDSQTANEQTVDLELCVADTPSARRTA